MCKATLFKSPKLWKTKKESGKGPVLIANAGIAQLVEQLIRNQQVVCSSHITSSRLLAFMARSLFYEQF